MKSMDFLKLSFLILWMGVGLTQAQTNEFTYQGKLTDSGTPAATYDFEFRLCDSGSPIIFEYKSGNALGLRGAGATVGFSAQEVQKIIPEAVNTSENGYLQINNDPILWTMLNAVKEQNAQILKRRREIDELKKIVCSLKSDAEICK